ncbi:Predicted Zn-dependent protease or its inactivated homolog [Granulicella pectinivorans]|jgi:predicted Zn-dependent protease|uniref:Predicted Zn-dependent protease or its inactivated homolog n=2 Tax=Granulicella pectinivorans TaxID=474950 RepID=A0A1I6LQC4_9BACT|nr:Predicted Zn-dependent protease or its inactivated homolog [Granulicella pectinivorans]
MVKLAVAFTLALNLGAFAAHVPAPRAAATAVNDPMLQAMKAELEREQAGLVLPGMQRPFFIEYRLDDIRTYEAIANYGALTREEEQHQRVVRVTVRIGSYDSDSSSSRGDGSLQLAPQDNDPAALRYALWTATDEAYKNALRAYSTKQATLKRFEQQRTEQDFAPAKAVTAIEPLVPLEIDRAEWKKRLIEASGLFLEQPGAAHIDYSTANVRGIAVNRFLVNTEGTVLRHGYAGYTDAISVGTQAPDGMRLSRDNGSTAAKASELESAAAFKKRVLDDLKSLEELRNAPVVSSEDYHGPVLFSGDASADVMNRLFVPNIEADRPELGTTARTQGAYTSSYRSRVLPEILSVTDDPTEKTFAGQTLLGSYTTDDEGVPAEAVDVVIHGKLTNYLIGRTPVRDFASSNGHGRAAPGQAAHARSAVITFKPTQAVPAAEMHARLLAMAREQGRDVYEVETLAGELAPRLLYLVHAKDGSKELVRGAVFDELDNRSLRSDIVAAGDDPFVAQTLGAVPQTTITPSLLFGDIGVKRATEEQQKLPYYPPPVVK